MRVTCISRTFVEVFVLVLFTGQFITACGGGGSSSNTGSNDVVVTNTAPVADAGTNQSVTTGTEVTLDASNSSDADGNSLSYSWTLSSIPAGSSATLTNAASVNSSFTSDIDGSYVVTLTVNDGTENSSVDSVTITSSTPTSTPNGTTKSYAIVDTNQTVCYNSSTGQSQTCSGDGSDADYSGNQPYYTLSNDGLTVADNVTGLTWVQSSDINSDGAVNYDDKLSQSDAVTYCQDLTLSGRDDWRLPSIKESYSLILFSGNDSGSSAAYVSFGRALGYMNGSILDVHGAGAQRSDDKTDVATGVFYYKGPQGDILRNNNKVRCVRDISS